MKKILERSALVLAGAALAGGAVFLRAATEEPPAQPAPVEEAPEQAPIVDAPLPEEVPAQPAPVEQAPIVEEYPTEGMPEGFDPETDSTAPVEAPYEGQWDTVPEGVLACGPEGTLVMDYNEVWGEWAYCE